MSIPKHTVLWRFFIWALASISFACLLGEFYGVWKMKPFACFILLPAMMALAFIAVRWKKSPDESRRELSTLMVEGVLGGLFAAVIYDLYRLPFVMNGYPLFKVFPEFGKMLLGASEPNWLVQLLGWGYHFSNGAALGIMLTMMVGRAPKKVLFWSATAWALTVEIILIMTPYRDFFKIHMPFQTFLVLTGTAHLLFGLALGAWCVRRIPRHPNFIH